MPHRISILMPAVFATSLAVVAELGTQGPASATGECLETFGSRGDQSGHWCYYTDRVHNRKCWYFERATPDPPATPIAPPAANGGSEESWLSQLATGMQTFLGTQDPPATTAKGVPAANPARTSANAPKQQSHAAPPPETRHATGAGVQISH